MEPVTLTAGAIATLAFQKFLDAGAGKLAEKFTEAAIAKMSELRQKIWDRLRGKHEMAEEALNRASTGDKQAIDTVATLLGVEMLDPKFATEIQAIAQEINAGKLQDNSSMVQNNYDHAVGFQNKVEGGTAYIGIHNYGKSHNPAQQ
jgi:hypothetical protein